MTAHVRTFGEFVESEGILKLTRETQRRGYSAFRETVDVNSRLLKVKISCHSCTAPKGCCTVAVHAYLWEAVPIADRLRRDGRDTPALRQELRAQAEAMEKSRSDYNAPCAFLAADERCTVYDERPGECAGHYVFSPPLQCSDPAATVIQKFEVADIAAVSGGVEEGFRQRLSLRKKVGRAYFGVLPRVVLLCLEAWDRTDFRDFFRLQPWPDMIALARESLAMLKAHNPDY